MTKKLCCIFNYAPHYRFPIFKKIDKELNADFYFGNRLNGGKIEKIDYQNLSGFQKELNCYFLGPLEYTQGWMRLAFSSKYDKFLITQNYFALNQWMFILCCFFLKKNVYCWTHGQKSSDLHFIHRFIGKIYYSFFKGIFLYGNRSREIMTRNGINPKKLHVIYNSLDYDRSKSLRYNIDKKNPYINHFKNHNPTILFIGRLTEVKKLDNLILVQRDLLKLGLPTNVVFIGDGPQRNFLQNMLTQEEQNRVWFVGSLYDESEIATYLHHADICLSPGNVGLTGIHCLSYGLPVITNDNFNEQMPEYEVIIKGKTGDFFHDNDFQNMVDVVYDWLRSHNDRDSIRKDCFNVIDSYYNPYYQINILKKYIGLKG